MYADSEMHYVTLVCCLATGSVTTYLVNKILYEVCNSYVDFNLLCAIYHNILYYCLKFGAHNHDVDYSAAHLKKDKKYIIIIKPRLRKNIKIYSNK